MCAWVLIIAKCYGQNTCVLHNLPMGRFTAPSSKNFPGTITPLQPVHFLLNINSYSYLASYYVAFQLLASSAKLKEQDTK